MNNPEKEKIVVQGHRGCRGLMPENSLPAFEKALQTGVTTLEMDVVVSAEGVVLVSHEPFMNPEICTHPDGSAIQPGEAEALNIFQMRFDSVKMYPCGTFAHPRFPEQKQYSCTKPGLKESLNHIILFCKENRISLPALNIELKSRPEWYDLYHPQPDEFAKLVHDVLSEFQGIFKISLQSFDMNVLKSLRKNYPDYTLVCLNEQADISMDQLFAELGFEPEVYSPNFSMTDAKLVEECRSRKVGLSVWTVNEKDDMKAMLDIGVTDIITDYPDRLNQVLIEYGYERE